MNTIFLDERDQGDNNNNIIIIILKDDFEPKNGMFKKRKI